MSDSAQRVVLLARAGEARERLQAALHEAGVEVALAADPAQIDVAGIHAAAPTALLVLLEPAVEEALEKLQPIFDQPAMTVIYDEAELALSRQGWDAARWMRHLIAKLEHHDDVLPPRLETAFAVQQPPVSGSDHSQREGVALDPPAEQQPTRDELTLAGEYDFAISDPAVALSFQPGQHDASVNAADYSPTPSVKDDLLSDAEDPLQGRSPALPQDTNVPNVDLSFDLSVDFNDAHNGWEILDSTAQAADVDKSSVASVPLDEELDEFAWRPREENPSLEVPAGLDDLVLRVDEFAPSSAQMSETPVNHNGHNGVASAEKPRAQLNIPSTGLELVDFDQPIPQPSAPVGSPASLEQSGGAAKAWSDLGKLDARISHLQLVDDTDVAAPAAQPVNGAIWVYAGIGGPDAIRNLLSALPADFSRPVVIQQKLDGARHDKLVQQLQRVSNLPVELAVIEQAPQPAHVYVLPQGMGLRAQADGWYFDLMADDALPDLSQVDGSRSALLMLSGSDPTMAEAAASLMHQGALLLAQSPEGCFDAAAPKALIAHGAQADAPAGLAARLQRH